MEGFIQYRRFAIKLKHRKMEKSLQKNSRASKQ